MTTRTRLTVLLVGLSVGVGLAGAAMLVAPRGASAAESDAGVAFYEKHAKDVLKACAEKIWLAADDAKKAGLHYFAAEQAERALAFDPDQAQAREHLGFVKKDGKWVEDAEKAEKLPRRNTRPSTRSEQAHAKFEQKWNETVLLAANRFCASRYAELGELCVAKGHPHQARKAWEAAIRLDRDNERARKGLGYSRFGKVWLTRQQDDARKAAAKADVVKDEARSLFEDALGRPLNKVESKHFRFESGYDVAELQDYAQAVETTYAYYLADFGRNPGDDAFGGARGLFIVASDEEQWDKLVDRFGGDDKEFKRQFAGMTLDPLIHVIRSPKTSNVETRRDMIVHKTVHMLNRYVWGLESRAWLDEGLAYYFSLKVLETCLTHCAVQKDKAKDEYGTPVAVREGGVKSWGEPENWKPQLKALVLKKADMPLGTLLTRPLTKLDFEASVKAWGVAAWLMDLDREKFTSILQKLRDPAAKQDMVIQDAYGKGLDAIDQEWHAYALRSY